MTLVWRPGFSGLTDADAIAYVSAVETADGQPLEFGVAKAINDFVVGCKLDGIWSAIKASCILAGARTLNGALIPLAGTAPTNVNFVSGDYNRKTGLVGDGSSKYLNSNRNNNADPQNSRHISIFLQTVDSLAGGRQYLGSQDLTGGSVVGRSGITTNLFSGLSNASGTAFANRGAHSGFVGIRRSTSSEITLRSNGSEQTNSATSETPRNEELLVYARPGSPVGNYTNARLAFYSIGESLDLAKLDTRVSALITAIGAAIP